MNALVEQALNFHLMRKHARTLTSVKKKILVTARMGYAQTLTEAINVLVHLDISYNLTKRLALVSCFDN